jgi:hypothetical protein
VRARTVVLCLKYSTRRAVVIARTVVLCLKYSTRRAVVIARTVVLCLKYSTRRAVVIALPARKNAAHNVTPPAIVLKRAASRANVRQLLTQ